PAYLLALPRSVSITAIGCPSALPIVSAVYVLPAPLGPTSARRSLPRLFFAFWNTGTSVTVVVQVGPRRGEGCTWRREGRPRQGPTSTATQSRSYMIR